MNLISEEIENYCEKYSSEENEVLYALNRQTHLRMIMPQMLSGPLQGQFLNMICRLVKPKRVLEIGTYTGYAAIQMALGMDEDSILHTIDKNEELLTIQKEFIAKSNLGHRIVLHSGDAKAIIPTLEELWDIVFVDADKVSYPYYYELLLPRMRKGGLILADNVLWSGKVLLDEADDEDTAALMSFNKIVKEDNRVDNLLLPLRDGVMMIIVK